MRHPTGPHVTLKMLYLFFSLGNERYALPSEPVRQIVPNVRLRPLPGSPAWIKGLLNYHESVVPVIDLSTLTQGQPVSDALGSRIILIERAPGTEGVRLIGLLAEKVLKVHSISEDEIRSSGVQASGASGLGRVTIRHGEMIHIVAFDDLLSDEQKSELFLEVAGGDS